MIASNPAGTPVNHVDGTAWLWRYAAKGTLRRNMLSLGNKGVRPLLPETAPANKGVRPLLPETGPAGASHGDKGVRPLLPETGPAGASHKRGLTPLSPPFLSDREQDAFSALRDTSRRDDWLLGRWLLKQLAAQTLNLDCQTADRLRRIEILPQTIDGLAARPQLVIDGVTAAGQVSLSHIAGGLVAAVSRDPNIRVGVDLVTASHPSDGFLRLWFTEQEQTFLQSRRDLAMLFWAAKEAAYKALQQGERFQPTAFEISSSGNHHWQCHYRKKGQDSFVQSTRRVGTRQKSPDPFSHLSVAIEFKPVAPSTWAVLAHSQSNQPHHPSTISPFSMAHP